MARTKVYPNAAASSEHQRRDDHLAKPSESVVLTVWKKSLLLNCDGFTVFDAKGNLVFRVDNYMAGGRGEIFLMDASGKSLLTIRRKRLSLAENWLVFDGEEAINPRYSVRKLVNILNSKSLAQVSAISFCANDENGNRTSPEKKVMYEIDGSYSRRCCAVYDDRRQRVAEIKLKEPVGGARFGLDVFHLLVQEPGIDSALAMALVIILDQMFGSSFISSS